MVEPLPVPDDPPVASRSLLLCVEAPTRRLQPRTRRVGDAENVAWCARFRAVR